jgi:hypothetical protein
MQEYYKFPDRVYDHFFTATSNFITTQSSSHSALLNQLPKHSYINLRIWKDFLTLQVLTAL